jgi:hypothetical protein
MISDEQYSRIEEEVIHRFGESICFPKSVIDTLLNAACDKYTKSEFRSWTGQAISLTQCAQCKTWYHKEHKCKEQ